MVLVLLILQSYFKVRFSPLSGISVLLLLACLTFPNYIQITQHCLQKAQFK